MNRIDYIRKKEKDYHDVCYQAEELFDEGSWLSKPVNTVMEELKSFDHIDDLHVLDLGCGIGRNSIPIAKSLLSRKGKVVCVDHLDSAINKLDIYSEKYGVSKFIDTRKNEIEKFNIAENEYHYIIGVSSLEHVRSKEILELKLKEMVLGTKINGSNCIIINTNITETEVHSELSLEPMFEINMATNKMFELLDKIYKEWIIKKSKVNHWTFTIKRDEKPVILKTACITYIAKRVQ